MVLGKIPVPGRSTYFENSRARAYCAYSRCGWGLFGHFFLSFNRDGRVVRWCWVNFQCRASYNLDYSRARAYSTCSKCGWGLFGHLYSHLSFLSSFSLSLGDDPI